MERVNVWKCDFCKKISFQKGTISKHEKECFHNPKTRSCAACLWFSPLIVGSDNPVQCHLGRIEEVPEGSRIMLKTQCEKWMDLNIYWENETCENEDEMEENLLSGNEDYFNALPLMDYKNMKRNSNSEITIAESGQVN